MEMRISLRTRARFKAQFPCSIAIGPHDVFATSLKCTFFHRSIYVGGRFRHVTNLTKILFRGLGTT